MRLQLRPWRWELGWGRSSACRGNSLSAVQRWKSCKDNSRTTGVLLTKSKQGWIRSRLVINILHDQGNWSCRIEWVIMVRLKRQCWDLVRVGLISELPRHSMRSYIPRIQSDDRNCVARIHVKMIEPDLCNSLSMRRRGVEDRRSGYDANMTPLSDPIITKSVIKMFDELITCRSK